MTVRRLMEQHCSDLISRFAASTSLSTLHLCLMITTNFYRSIRPRAIYSRSQYLRMSSNVTPLKRTFPPLYSSQGNEAVDRLAFVHVLERLKVPIRTSNSTIMVKLNAVNQTQKRTGWVDHNVCLTAENTFASHLISPCL